MNPSAKNILIVCHHYPPHITGVGTVAHNQARHLVELGHKVTVITSDTAGNEKSGSVGGVSVVRVRALNFLEKFDAPFPIFSLSILSTLIREVKKADLVHIHDGFYMSSFFAAVVARWYKKRIILTQHVAWVMHPSKLVFTAEKIVYATTGALIFRWSDLIITYNDRVRKFLVDKGIPEKKLRTLTNGVDMDFFHTVSPEEKKSLKIKFGFDTRRKVILFVGRFVPKKGFDKVLNSQSDDYQLVFAGGDSGIESTNNVVFLGKLLPIEISKIYQASDVFILPSESEGFPLSIQEAMACGLPIIAATDPGYKSYDLDPEKFYMIDNPTNESVRIAIESVVKDDNNFSKMAEYSERYARENFDWSLAVEKLEKIYNELLEVTEKGKRIAFVSDAVYPFNKGGKEKRLFDITKLLAKDGYEVTVYCMQWWKEGKVFVNEGVTYYAISPLYPLYENGRRSIKQAVLFALHCLKLINKPFDIMDVDHIPHLVLFTTKIVAVLKGKKMVATWHEVWGRKYWQNYLGNFSGMLAYMIERVGSRLPDKIVSVSDHTTRELRAVLGVSGEIITVPNGLDFSVIRESRISNKGSDVIFAGRLLANKNIDMLIRAISVLKSRGMLLKTYIIGEGPEREALELLNKNMGTESQIDFLGFLEKHSDLYGIIKSSKVFVLPSTREGFGIAVIEANACGVPVVTIDHEYNAAKNLITTGENGIVCHLDENSLADAIRKQIDTRVQSEFYTKYSEKFDWNNLFPLIQTVYR